MNDSARPAVFGAGFARGLRCGSPVGRVDRPGCVSHVVGRRPTRLSVIPDGRPRESNRGGRGRCDAQVGDIRRRGGVPRHGRRSARDIGESAPVGPFVCDLHPEVIMGPGAQAGHRECLELARDFRRGLPEDLGRASPVRSGDRRCRIANVVRGGLAVLTVISNRCPSEDRRGFRRCVDGEGGHVGGRRDVPEFSRREDVDRRGSRSGEHELIRKSGNKAGHDGLGPLPDVVGRLGGESEDVVVDRGGTGGGYKRENQHTPGHGVLHACPPVMGSGFGPQGRRRIPVIGKMDAREYGDLESGEMAQLFDK